MDELGKVVKIRLIGEKKYPPFEYINVLYLDNEKYSIAVKDSILSKSKPTFYCMEFTVLDFNVSLYKKSNAILSSDGFIVNDIVNGVYIATGTHSVDFDLGLDE